MISFKPIRGMHDTLPDALKQQHVVLNTIIDVLSQFGCDPIQLPLLETTALFKRSVGITSDIVQKEMYTFEDQGEESLSLRPEGTAGCYRAYLNHFQRAAPFQKLWYYGPMYRRERPQKGRQREFYQLGVEFFGYASIKADVELLLLIHSIFKALKLDNHMVCRLNYLPSSEDRSKYTDALKKYFAPMVDQFDDVHRLRFEQNPLRLLDSKDQKVIAMLKDAPILSSFLSEQEHENRQWAIDQLTKIGIPIVIDEHMVRGLDYYSGIIFEWQANEGLGAQNTVCAGGRTDALGELLGGKTCHSLGMAIGIERLMIMLNEINSIQTERSDVFLCADSESAANEIIHVQQRLHQLGYKTFLHHGISQVKKQINRAEKMGFQYLLLIQENQYVCYDLESKQQTPIEDLTTLKGVITHAS